MAEPQKSDATTNRGAVRLAAYREQKGCSQESIGKACGVNQATVSRWLSGLQAPKTAQRILLSKRPFRIPIASWDEPAERSDRELYERSEGPYAEAAAASS